MGESFEKFKKKILVQTWIKCLCVGFGAALAVTGILLLVLKLTGEENAYWYLLIGIPVLPAVAGVMFLFLRPTDEKTAKLLDKELSLQEKTRTMVAFREEEGTIVELQREEVLGRLDKTPLKRLPFRRLWCYVLTPVLALALFVSGICVPIKAAVTPTEPDDPYVFDSYDRGLLQSLIREIREDEQLQQTPKDGYVGELEKLLSVMETVQYESEKEAAVLSTIEATYVVGKEANTADEIAAVLQTSENSGVVALGNAFETLKYATLKASITGALDVIELTVNFETGTSASLEELHNRFGVLLTQSSLERDELYLAVLDLDGQLYSSRTAGDGEAIYEQFSAAMEAETITDALDPQAYTYNRAQYIETRLRSIFGMSAGEDKPGNKPGKPDRPTDITPPQEIVDGPGGIGGNETDYGSDEKFFDPERGYVSYGEIIDEYYNYVRAMREEGAIPDEFEDFILKYFGILYGGVSEEDAN